MVTCYCSNKTEENKLNVLFLMKVSSVVTFTQIPQISQITLTTLTLTLTSSGSALNSPARWQEQPELKKHAATFAPVPSNQYHHQTRSMLLFA